MNVVAIGAHPDDIELGVGGSIALHAKRGDDITFLVLTKGSELSKSSERIREAEQAAETLGVDDVQFLGFADTQIPYDNQLVKQLDKRLAEHQADRVYIHAEADTHQDHKKASLGSIAATRNCKEVLAFESPSTRSSFEPQYYVPLSERELQRKIEAIKTHKSQKEKKYLEADAMEGLARFRGRQANVTYAEAFQTIRMVEPRFIRDTLIEE